MSYNHLSIDERSCLQFYYVQGLSVRKISKLLNRSPSTISREIRRNCWQLVRGVFYYYATTAQRKAKRRKRFCHRGTYFSNEVKAYIEQKLALTWSPEQIANTPCNLNMPSASTIYRLIYSDRKAETVAALVIKTLSALPKGAVKTITTDNGNEFALWENIEQALDCEIYFTDTYCSWQKGSNENANGLLREFYPKGRNLSHVNSKTLEKNLAFINARPKKVLSYVSPQDLFNSFLSKCCT